MASRYGRLGEASDHENISHVQLKGHHQLSCKLELLRVFWEFNTCGESNQGSFDKEVVHNFKLLAAGD